MNVEMANHSDSVRDGTVQLARALCSDAPLYGGHACLSCQSAAWQLMTRSEGGAFGSRARMIQPPPHGTSHRTCASQWARLLGTIGAPS